ncbi:MAG: helix-turn-helix domain-containing protein [Muribaculaceae bacterium]|nr:helix-turn-helix domain-containing protein [Muribaculaceae bacterium]
MTKTYNHTRKSLFFVFFLYFSMLTGQAAFSDKGETLLNDCENAIASRQYDVLEKKASDLVRLGKTQSNREEEVTGEALHLHALISVRDTADFTIPIDALIKELPTLKESNLKSYLIVCRTVSSYYQRIINDYSQALHYATEHLETARHLNDKNAEAAALSTIASIYFQKQDNSGWEYALKAYDLSKEINDLSTRYVTACNMANYLFNNNKYDEALKYLKEAEGFAKQAGLKSENSYINSFMGDIYMRLGKTDLAEKFYILSMEDNPVTPNYDKIYSRICYAIFMIEQKRLNDALKLLMDIGDMSRAYKVTIFEKEIFSLMSIIYERQGDYAKSLEYYKKYTDVTLNLFSEQKEREFAILDLRNKVREEELKNASQSLEIMKRGRTIIILTAIGVLFLIICVAGFIYHRRKISDYKQTIARYLENMRNEKLLREQLEQANIKAQQRDTSNTTTGGLNDEKSKQLYQQIEKLMNEGLYRDSSLSLDKAAGLLSTNRTYLSQVVNEHYGKSFSSYVSEYRLNEAVELLSDPDNTDPLKTVGAKVGFTSPSNFYTLFRQRVGVSPSVFRENVKNV